jgi:hypothetical protein
MRPGNLRNVLAGVAFLILVGFVINASNVIGTSKLFKIGQMISQEVKKNDEQVVMIVNGDPITKQDYAIQKILLQTTDEKVSDETVNNKLIETTVIYQEAKRRGLEPSLNEAQEFAKMQKNLLLSEPKAENADLIIEYIEAQGFTVDEYFEANVESYKKGLAMANLRNAIFDETIQKMGAEVTFETKNDVFISFIHDLIGEAKIE